MAAIPFIKSKTNPRGRKTPRIGENLCAHFRLAPSPLHEVQQVPLRADPSTSEKTQRVTPDEYIMEKTRHSWGGVHCR